MHLGVTEGDGWGTNLPIEIVIGGITLVERVVVSVLVQRDGVAHRDAQAATAAARGDGRRRTRSVQRHGQAGAGVGAQRRVDAWRALGGY